MWAPRWPPERVLVPLRPHRINYTTLKRKPILIVSGAFARHSHFLNYSGGISNRRIMLFSWARSVIVKTKTRAVRVALLSCCPAELVINNGRWTLAMLAKGPRPHIAEGAFYSAAACWWGFNCPWGHFQAWFREFLERGLSHRQIRDYWRASAPSDAFAAILRLCVTWSSYVGVGRLRRRRSRRDPVDGAMKIRYFVVVANNPAGSTTHNQNTLKFYRTCNNLSTYKALGIGNGIHLFVIYQAIRVENPKKCKMYLTALYFFHSMLFSLFGVQYYLFLQHSSVSYIISRTFSSNFLVYFSFRRIVYFMR